MGFSITTPAMIAAQQAKKDAEAAKQAALAPLTKQIMGSSDTSKWSGEGYGSAEANARAMADILSGIGITDIKQFGKVPELQKLEIGGYTYNGKPAVLNWDGRMLITADKPSGVDENGNDFYERVALTPEQAAQAKPVYGTYSTSYESVNGEQGYSTVNFTPVDQSKVVMNGGVPSIPTGNFTYGNKETGQTVPNTYSERQTGTAWGGTFAGDGNTGFRVQFDPKGNPVFYTTGASSSDLGNLMPVISVALMATGAGAGLGAALMGGSSVAATALGSGIISGVMSEATGGDFLKGAVTGAVGAGIGAYAGDVGAALGVTDPNMAKAVGSAVLSGAASEATGGDFITGAVSGALSAGAGQMAGEALGMTGTTASTVGTSLVKGVVAELQGKDVTDAMISGAVSGYLSGEKAAKAATALNKASDEDLAAGLNPEYGTNESYDEFMKNAMTPEAQTAIENEIVKPSSEFSSTDLKPDYSLTTGITFPSTEGLKVEPIKDAGATVGESPVDYGFNVTDGLGLQMPTSPNIDSMGGGQGLTVKTPEGVLSESGVTATGTASDLGDPNSFINKPAPDVTTESSFDPKEALKLAMKMLGAVSVGGAAFNAVTSDSSTQQPVNLNYGDIYKDAPIKGFAMRKGEDNKYTPYIGEKAQLSNGGLLSRRK